MKARIVSHEAAARNKIYSLDLTGVAMICLCYLEISGSPVAFALSSASPLGSRAGIAHSCWHLADGRNAPNDDRLRAAIEADHFATSLAGAGLILPTSRP